MKFLRNFWRWLIGLFKKAKAALLMDITEAVNTVERLKTIMNSPVVDILATAIPGTLDDRVVMVLRAHLPNILRGLKVCEACRHEVDDEAMIFCVMKAIGKESPEMQNTYLGSVATQIALILADGKISWGELSALVEYVYLENVKRKV